MLSIKFHEKTSRGSRVVPSGETDMTKLIVAFRSFANAPKVHAACDRSFFVWPSSCVGGKSRFHSLTPRFVSTARARARHYSFETGYLQKRIKKGCPNIFQNPTRKFWVPMFRQ